MRYLVLSRHQDEIHIEWIDAATLDKRLNVDHEYDGCAFINPPRELECFPANSVCIIKGDVIVPKAVTTVTRFEI